MTEPNATRGDVEMITMKDKHDDATETASTERSLEGGVPSSEDDASRFIVDWDGPNDDNNPYNWSTGKKILNVSLVSVMTFLAPLGSSIFAPSIPEVMAEFHSSSKTLASFIVSVYLIGFIAGPFAHAPLAEVYGRRIVYNVSNVGFVAFSVGCALAPSLNALIVLRLFCGAFGCCAVTIGGGSIADMVTQEKRASAMAWYAMGPIMGPVLGPIAGGFLTQAASWRWTFWLVTIAAGIVTVIMFFAVSESYAPVILERKAARLRRETGNEMLKSRFDSGLTPNAYLRRAIVRPLKLLFRSPVAIIASGYMALSFGYLYLMFTTMSSVFQGTYGFSTGMVGLAYLGLGVGSLVGTVVTSWLSNRQARQKAKAAAEGEQDAMAPEFRLKALTAGSLLLPMGLFAYGWTAQYEVHWIVPIICQVPVGVANLVIFMSVQLYLIDTFTLYAASAMAANTVVRSLVGAVLPLAGLPMFSALGLGWGNSLLGFIALATVPLAMAMIKWGAYLRIRYEIKNL